MCQLPADQNERVIVYDKYMITLFTLEEVMRQSTIQLPCNHCGGELTVDAERSIIVCPYCGEEPDMEIGPDDEMPEAREDAVLLEVIEGAEEVEQMDALLSLAITGGDPDSWI